MIGSYLLAEDANTEIAPCKPLPSLPNGSRSQKSFDLLLDVVQQKTGSDRPINDNFEAAVGCVSRQPKDLVTRCLVQGSREAGKTSLIFDWAMILAMKSADSQWCCSQCQSNPETCQCNDVDLILCRHQSNLHPRNVSSNGSSTSESFPSFLLNQISSPQDILALRRIRVHTVGTRRQFLALLLKMQGRPISEQSRRAILVDDMDNLCLEDGAHCLDDDVSQKHRQDMVLSQLGMFVLLQSESLNTSPASHAAGDGSLFPMCLNHKIVLRLSNPTPMSRCSVG